MSLHTKKKLKMMKKKTVVPPKSDGRSISRCSRYTGVQYQEARRVWSQFERLGCSRKQHRGATHTQGGLTPLLTNPAASVRREASRSLPQWSGIKALRRRWAACVELKDGAPGFESVVPGLADPCAVRHPFPRPRRGCVSTTGVRAKLHPKTHFS